jgi:hypothetical protein
MAQTVFKWQGVVGADGKVQVPTVVAPGTRVEVLILAPPGEEFDDLITACQSSAEFWDNPVDDEEWNETQPR